jgi:di/tricarboxylate transporter
MTQDQVTFVIILVVTAGMFVWGRWRHDMVALAALIACVIAGLVPAAQAFAGFGHPAVITVACVLILSQSLQVSGAVDAMAGRLKPGATRPTTAIGIITGIAALLSAVMNNVGALALLMPMALQIAAQQNLPPGKVLMPLAFGSILGGMTTLIGTPPNLIVSSFRAAHGSGAFAMFDFTPVGLSVAIVGVASVALFGWRLVPDRKGAGNAEFDTGAYLTEARVPEKGKANGMTLREIEHALEKADAQVVGLIRSEVRIMAPSPSRKVRAGDTLVIEGDSKALTSALSVLGLKLAEAVAETKGNGEDNKATDKPAPDTPVRQDAADSKPPKPADPSGLEEIVLRELVVLPNAAMAGRSATDIRLRTRFSINLLAISRKGQRSMARLRTVPIEAGDVLLVQGTQEAILEFASQHGCAPLAERTLRIPDRQLALKATAILLLSIGAAASGLLPTAIAFALGVLATMVLRVVSPARIYDAVDWPVIVLLGAMMPVAGAMATTGTADLVAGAFLAGIPEGHAVVALTLVLIVTMTLSDFMNNAATAAVMCPIALSTAKTLGAQPDPFLMAVAIGASCSFLTPIGHQNNTLILGPGGFRFGDYWRLGLIIEILVVIVAVPMLLLVWPL